MKGDFSKPPLDARRRFAGVLMQQGRVSLDSDWNEQVAIENRRAETMMRDLIGPSGAPRDAAGYAIVASHRLEFDGVDDFVHVGDAEPMTFGDNTPLTLEAWIRPQASKAHTAIAGRLDVRTGGERLRGSYLLGLEADQSLAFHLVVDTESAVDASADAASQHTRTRRVVSVRSPVKIAGETWSHAAATFDGTIISLYVNGRAVARGSISGRTPKAHGPFLMGARLQDGQPTWFFHGSIADVRVWSTARTDREIASSMRRVLTGDEPGLVANWRLDDGREVVRDIGPWHCDGRLGGGDDDSQPRWKVADVRIGPGRFYVDGIQCEHPRESSMRSQPDLPGAWVPNHHRHHGVFAVYLEVWRQYVSATDDPELREVALGGPDTTGRIRTVAQVRMSRVHVEHHDDPDHFEKAWSKRIVRGRGAKMSVRRPPSAAYLGNNLYRVEVHDAGYLTGSHAEGHTVRVVTVTETRIEIVVEVAIEEIRWVREGRLIDFLVDGQVGHRARGRIVHIDVETLTIVIELLVETVDEHVVPDSHHGIRPAATVKWSRDNGYVVFPVRDSDGASVRLVDVDGDVPELRVGDWIELTDAHIELNGNVGPLHRITSIDDRRTLIDLDPPPPADFGHDATARPRLRRWDQKTQGGRPLANGLIAPAVVSDAVPWIDVERGIEMAFDGNGWLETGDYWMVPARTITEALEWPEDANGPMFLEPNGIERHFALLAKFDFDGRRARVHDLRPLFHPLAHRHRREDADEAVNEQQREG